MTGDPALRLSVQGRVQGVGFRWWAVKTALRLDVRGWVRNRADGSVEIQAIGSPDRLEAFIQACRTGPATAKVTSVLRAPAEDDGATGFEQRADA